MQRLICFIISIFLIAAILAQDVHIEGDILLDQGANRIISVEDGGEDHGRADDLTIQAASGIAFNSSGGHLFLLGGNGSSGGAGVTTQKGGDVIIRPGNSIDGFGGGAVIVKNVSGSDNAIFDAGINSFMGITLIEKVGLPGDGNTLLNLNSERSWAFRQSGSDATTTLVLESVGGGGNKNFVIKTAGHVGIGITTPIHPLHMASGAHVTTGGAWTNASSRSLKENIRNLTVEEAISTLYALNPVKFNYLLQKDEEYIGFIAEDVPDLVATQDRRSLSSMDIVAVLSRVVQDQQLKMNDLSEQVSELIALKNEMAELKQLINTHKALVTKEE